MSSKEWQQDYPAIKRHLTDTDGELSETVVDWVTGSLAEYDHAYHLDEALTWGEDILRFKSVRRSLCQGNFWEAYCQLRLAWWLDRCGLKAAEFEPRTVGKKKADIRSRLGSLELDSEVTSPNPGASEKRSVRNPFERLRTEIEATEIDDVTITVDHEGQASFESLTDEAARRIASRLAVHLRDESFSESGERNFEFPDVVVRHIKIKGLPDEVQPGDQPLRLHVKTEPGKGVRFISGIDVMAFAKPPRPIDRQSSENVHWITSTLIEKAEQLSPSRFNGIWIESTRDNNVLAAVLAPWGISQALQEFWENPRSQHIDFVALFELKPGLPYVLPGVGGLMMDPVFNPRSRLAEDETALKLMSEAWATWAKRVHTAQAALWTGSTS